MYPDLSRAYWKAVHAVLTRKKSAKQPADELQVELQQMLEIPAVPANAEFDKTASQGREVTAHRRTRMSTWKRMRLR
jgi:hypothetical protein